MAGIDRLLRYWDAMSPVLASVIILAAFALAAGGFRLVALGKRRQGSLMVLAALVIVANLALLMMPVAR
jgi:hypothetical protein